MAETARSSFNNCTSHYTFGLAPNWLNHCILWLKTKITLENIRTVISILKDIRGLIDLGGATLA